jgi:hypothetical protein
MILAGYKVLAAYGHRTTRLSKGLDELLQKDANSKRITVGDPCCRFFLYLITSFFMPSKKKDETKS